MAEFSKDTVDEEVLNPLSPEILKILVENHQRFRSFLLRRVSDEAAAEDLLQLSLKKALESPPSKETKTSVLAWFFKTLRNSLIDYYRSRETDEKKKRELQSALVDEDAKVLGLDELKDEVCRCMNGLLPALKPEYAELIRRIDLNEEDPETVARSLSLKRGNLDVKLHRARQALKTSLEQACGTCTKHGCLNCTCQ